jgi:hypothetical protein
MNKLDFKTYMLASDSPDGRLGCSSLRRTDEWFRFFEAATEMVEKYGLDGSGIPIGANVMFAEQCSAYMNQNRGYKGLSGGKVAVFAGPVKDEKWKDHYFCTTDKVGESWFYRPCWWRFLIVLP